jgi:hypothetical protein
MLVSRVASYDWMVSFAVQPIGYVAAGPLAEAIGSSSTLLLAAGMMLAAAVGVQLVPSVRRVTAVVAQPARGEPAARSA